MREDTDIRPPDHNERLAAAIKRAEWELGDGTWAGVLVGAYLWPNADSKALEMEKNG